MTTLIAYVLLQIPGWILLAGLLFWADSNGWLEPPAASLIMLLWVLKDALLYPLAKRAYSGQSPSVGAEALVGKEAQAVTTLAPKGLVKIAGELWTAEAAGSVSISEGSKVYITSTEGLTLTVVDGSSGSCNVAGSGADDDSGKEGTA